MRLQGSIQGALYSTYIHMISEWNIQIRTQQRGIPPTLTIDYTKNKLLSVIHTCIYLPRHVVHSL